MRQRILLDTDILVNLIRNSTETVAAVERLDQDYSLSISAATEMELIVGCRDKKELATLTNFLKKFTILGINSPVSDIAVRFLYNYKLSHGLQIADAIIAATAVAEHIPLFTGNKRHFRSIAGLTLQ